MEPAAAVWDLHGDADLTVPLLMSDVVMAIAEQWGIPHDQVVIEGGGHGIARYLTGDVLEVMFTFIFSNLEKVVPSSTLPQSTESQIVKTTISAPCASSACDKCPLGWDTFDDGSCCGVCMQPTAQTSSLPILPPSTLTAVTTSKSDAVTTSKSDDSTPLGAQSTVRTAASVSPTLKLRRHVGVCLKGILLPWQPHQNDAQRWIVREPVGAVGECRQAQRNPGEVEKALKHPVRQVTTSCSTLARRLPAGGNGGCTGPDPEGLAYTALASVQMPQSS